MSETRFVPGPLKPNSGPQTVELVPRPYLEAPSQNAPPPDDGENQWLLNNLRVLRRYKGTLLLFALLGAIAGVLYSVPQTPVYQALIAIEIQGLNDDFLNMRNINPTAESNFDPYYDIQTQVREMQSRPLMERVIKKMKAGDIAALAADTGRIATWRAALHLAPPKPPSIQTAIEKANVTFRPSMNSRIVEISCDSVNPRVAAQFVNTLAEEYIQQNLENRWAASQKTGEFLTRQLQDLKIKLERSEDGLQTYMRSADLMIVANEGDKGPTNDVAESKLRQLQDELLKAETDRVLKQSRQELSKSSPSDSMSEVLNDKSLAEAQARLTDLHRQMAELNLSLMPENPKVQKLQVQIDSLEAALKKSRSNILGGIDSDYQAALNRENLLKAQYTLQQNLVSDQSAKRIHYNILKREVDTNRQIYDAMLQKVKEFGIASAMKASGVTIVDPAVPPLFPYKPNLQRAGIFGLLIGLSMGVMFTFLRERSDRNLQQPGDTPFYLNVPELGVIPTRPMERTVRVKGAKLDLETNGASRPDLSCVELAMWNRKMSVLAEAFRTTLTSLLFSGHNGTQPRLIVLTSASPSEGKTTVSINMAIALSEINGRVLLIDADMRRPRVEKVFGLGPGPGLADLLTMKTSADRSLFDRTVCSTSIPGLFVMRSGGAPGVVSNLLHSSRLPELLQELRAEFDAIVIDTPPVLPISDARVIGRFADAVVLVVRAGKTTRDAALMVKRRLAADGTPILGTILNGWDSKQGAYGYRYREYNANGAYYGPKEASADED